MEITVVALEQRLLNFIYSVTGDGAYWRNVETWPWSHIITEESSGYLWEGLRKIIREADAGEALTSPNEKIRECWRYFNENT